MQLRDKAVVAVLLYLFWRIEKRLDGSRTLVFAVLGKLARLVEDPLQDERRRYSFDAESE
jgi:type IV secretory pathway VirB4 component